MTKQLSPAAQAVLDAAYKVRPWMVVRKDSGDIAAAALRAAAGFIYMEHSLGDTDADAGVFAAHNAISTSLLAIADELEAQ
jgi:hypothetical protein